MFNPKISLSMPVRVLVLAAFIVAAIQFPASAGKQDFVFVNNSGQVVTELRFSPSTHTDFEGNVLSSPIYHGESRDFKVVTSNGTVWTWYGIDLLAVDKITVDENGTIHY